MLELFRRQAPKTANLTTREIALRGHGARVAASEPVRSLSGQPRSFGKSNVDDRPWQDRLREFYDDENRGIGILGQIVDFYANGVALFPISVGIRDMQEQYVHVDDPALQSVGAEWRDIDTDMQAPLIREITVARKLAGEYVMRQVTNSRGQGRFQVLHAPQLDAAQRYTDQFGRPVQGVRFRRDTQTPARGDQMPGEYEWVLEDDLRRVWQKAIPYTGEATSDLKRILRWLTRIDQLDEKAFRAIDSRLMINKILLLASRPEHERGDNDRFVDDFLNIAELSRHDAGDAAWKSAPFIGRVNDPGDAQLLDLGGDVEQTDLAAMVHYVTMIAQSVSLPAAALVEGTLTNRYSDFLLDRQIQRRAFEPEIEKITIDGTSTFLRPLIAEMQESFGLFTQYDVSDLRFIWRPVPPSLANQPDLILRAWSLGLIDLDEATALMGTSAPTPGTDGYSHWQIATGRAGGGAEAEELDEGSPPLGTDDAGNQLTEPDGQPNEEPDPTGAGLGFEQGWWK